MKPWVKTVTRKVGFEFNVAICYSNATMLKQIYGRSVPSYWYDSKTNEVWYREGDLEKLGERLAALVIKDPHFVKNDLEIYEQRKNRILQTAEKISNLDFKKMSNGQLGKVLLNFEQHYQAFYPFLTTPHAVDRFFVPYLGRFAEEKQESVDPERVSALRIVDYVRSKGRDSNYRKLLQDHIKNFCWMSCWEMGAEPLGGRYFQDEVDSLAATSRSVPRGTTALAQYLNWHVTLRTERKNVLCKTHYLVLPSILEAGKRLSLSREEVLLLSFREVGVALKCGRPGSLIDSRKDGWATYQDGGKLQIITGSEKILRLRKKLGFEETGVSGITKVEGTVACRGQVVGPAKVVLDINQLDKVQKGDILIARMTTPDYVLAMNKCAGIITDEGGMTCHAAIVSRELGVPCIIGTKLATRVFKDGDLIQLDASNEKTGSARISHQTH